ncbi:hypothetical protein AOQ84DRAFT_303135 [Glonium stellatum]|uniref:Mediator of RNA polymerase II transcription subunit 17 n=1 Tax=Glonium stellatum TaxID=574774 RepID=A0A8E2ER39_9PEZI|nr:hypothetical protein AOQ84DRAFT_303135 [Glonium stellatum]
MSELGPGSVPVSLRPWPTEDPGSEDLQLQLERLYEQRGHFRHITEEGLQEEINNAEDGPADVMEGIEESEAPATTGEKERRAEIYAAKAQMQQLIGIAHNEAMVALDFISLLVSKDSPNTADITMSPSLKQSVPKGSLGFDKWPISEPEELEKRKQDLVAKGWRMKGLESAADSVLKAATRLENEVRKETQYWEQVLSIAKKGWSVRRIPREKHTLGVQFGFSEASDYFKGRGFAPLRMNDDGSIILDAELTQRPKAVRVRIMQDGKITGTSKLPSPDDTLQPSIEDLIRRARDSLFEEELYHEISLETRILLSYDVKLRDSIIHLPAPTSDGLSEVPRTVLIDIVPLDEVLPETNDHSSDMIAQNTAEALRVLLSYAHRQRLHRRSQMPPPLSERKRQTPPPPILRPLLNYFQNSKAINSIRDYFGRTRKTLSSAGLDVTFKLNFDPKLSNILESMGEPAKENTSLLDKLVSTLINPSKTTAALCLPSTVINPALQEEVVVEIWTHVTQQAFGTEYTLTLPSSSANILFSATDSKRNFSFTSLPELTSYIDLLLSLDLSHSLIAREHKGWLPSDRTPEVSKAMTHQKRQEQKQLGVKLENGTLMLHWRWAERLKRAEEYIWDGRGGKMGFRQVVEKYVGSS